MQRKIQPEILDKLPENHPDALKNLRDLRVINALMRSNHWFASQLSRHLNADDRILEIGAGEGRLGDFLLGRVVPREVPYTAVDRRAFANRRMNRIDWVHDDILKFANPGKYDIILTNLILHQFTAAELSRIGRRIGRSARVIIASEPSRRHLHLLQMKAGRLLGFNYVSRHDARVSIIAGFRGDELPRFLGLDPGSWTWSVSLTFFGAYRLVARRNPGR